MQAPTPHMLTMGSSSRSRSLGASLLPCTGMEPALLIHSLAKVKAMWTSWRLPNRHHLVLKHQPGMGPALCWSQKHPRTQMPESACPWIYCPYGKTLWICHPNGKTLRSTTHMGRPPRIWLPTLLRTPWQGALGLVLECHAGCGMKGGIQPAQLGWTVRSQQGGKKQQPGRGVISSLRFQLLIRGWHTPLPPPLHPPH